MAYFAVAASTVVTPMLDFLPPFCTAGWQGRYQTSGQPSSVHVYEQYDWSGSTESEGEESLRDLDNRGLGYCTLWTSSVFGQVFD